MDSDTVTKTLTTLGTAISFVWDQFSEMATKVTSEPILFSCYLRCWSCYWPRKASYFLSSLG